MVSAETDGSDVTNQFGGAVDARLVRAQPGERSVGLQAGGELRVGWVGECACACACVGAAGEVEMIPARGMQRVSERGRNQVGSVWCKTRSWIASSLNVWTEGSTCRVNEHTRALYSYPGIRNFPKYHPNLYNNNNFIHHNKTEY